MRINIAASGFFLSNLLVFIFSVHAAQLHFQLNHLIFQEQF